MKESEPNPAAAFGAVEATGWQGKTLTPEEEEIFRKAGAIGNEFAAGSAIATTEILKETLQGAGELAYIVIGNQIGIRDAQNRMRDLILSIISGQASRQLGESWAESIMKAEQASLNNEWAEASRLLTKTNSEIVSIGAGAVGGVSSGRALIARLRSGQGWFSNARARVASPKSSFFHSTSDAVVDLIMNGGFRTDIPNPQAAFHNNRFGRGVYLSDTPAAALSERPGGVVLSVDAKLGRNLNIVNRGPIFDSQIAKALSRGARKHGFDSITTVSVQPNGGINTIILDPANVRAIGVFQ